MIDADKLLRAGRDCWRVGEDAWRPVRIMPLVEWVRENVVMPTGAPLPGPFDVSFVPAAVEIYEAWNDSAVREIVVRGPTQTLKSALMINILLYEASVFPGPMAVFQPDKALAKSFSQTRIPDAAAGSPMANYFPRTGRGAAGGTIAERVFPGGTVNIAGVADVSALISRSFRVVLIDEVSAMDSSIDVVGMTNDRMTAFPDSRRLIVSSPGDEGLCRITSEYERGDMREWNIKCPACGHYQVPEWNNVHYDQKDPGTASYGCSECGQVMDDSMLREANRQGRYEARRDFNGVASFTMNALANPFLSLADLMGEWHEAMIVARTTGDLSRVRTHVINRQCIPWADRNRRLDAVEVSKSTICKYPRKHVPEGVVAATMAVDVQDSALYWEIAGWGVLDVKTDDLKELKALGGGDVGAAEDVRHAPRRWGLGYGIIPGDPSGRSVWQKLEEIYGQTFELSCGTKIRPSIMFVDSGGHYTDAVRDFVQGRGRGRDLIYPVKGANKMDEAVYRVSSSRLMLEKYANELIFIGTFAVKEIVYRLLSASRHQVGSKKFYNYPRDRSRGYDMGYFESLTSEEKVLARDRSGHVKAQWVCAEGRNNEALDVAVYNYSAMRYLGGVQYLLNRQRAIAERVQG